ncbi:hypothetical protein NEOKW01_0195 [Nematocida sp. AWRm80]|nr:hypothetical protein NEOKW01_0195 [Nematocida sp. AWRm80]
MRIIASTLKLFCIAILATASYYSVECTSDKSVSEVEPAPIPTSDLTANMINHEVKNDSLNSLRKTSIDNKEEQPDDDAKVSKVTIDRGGLRCSGSSSTISNQEPSMPTIPATEKSKSIIRSFFSSSKKESKLTSKPSKSSDNTSASKPFIANLAKYASDIYTSDWYIQTQALMVTSYFSFLPNPVNWDLTSLNIATYRSAIESTETSSFYSISHNELNIYLHMVAQDIDICDIINIKNIPKLTEITNLIIYGKSSKADPNLHFPNIIEILRKITPRMPLKEICLIGLKLPLNCQAPIKTASQLTNLAFKDVEFFLDKKEQEALEEQIQKEAASKKNNPLKPVPPPRKQLSSYSYDNSEGMNRKALIEAVRKNTAQSFEQNIAQNLMVSKQSNGAASDKPTPSLRTSKNSENSIVENTKPNENRLNGSAPLPNIPEEPNANGTSSYAIKKAEKTKVSVLFYNIKFESTNPLKKLGRYQFILDIAPKIDEVKAISITGNFLDQWLCSIETVTISSLGLFKSVADLTSTLCDPAFKSLHTLRIDTVVSPNTVDYGMFRKLTELKDLTLVSFNDAQIFLNLDATTFSHLQTLTLDIFLYNKISSYIIEKDKELVPTIRINMNSNTFSMRYVTIEPKASTDEALTMNIFIYVCKDLIHERDVDSLFSHGILAPLQIPTKVNLFIYAVKNKQPKYLLDKIYNMMISEFSSTLIGLNIYSHDTLKETNIKNMLKTCKQYFSKLQSLSINNFILSSGTSKYLQKHTMLKDESSKKKDLPMQLCLNSLEISAPIPGSIKIVDTEDSILTLKHAIDLDQMAKEEEQ